MNDTTNSIQMIDVRQIWPHKDNPRKDLGDLTELADSIKKNGVLQNLTVVKKYGNISGKWDPESPAYTVVIGHRRLAAAKLAGLEKVPCVVADMSETEQFNTMMEENMQRSDLTPLEQADGFQYMLDLGQTKEEISEKTGFSKTTIDRRLKLRTLDRDKFKAAQDRGATLFDYMKLFNIEDPEGREKVLESIGTPNFNNMYESTYDAQERKKRTDKVLAVVKTFAKPFPKGKEGDRYDGSKYRQAAYYSCARDDEEVKVLDDGKNYFYAESYGSVVVYEPVTKKPKDATPKYVTDYKAWYEPKRKSLDDMGERHSILIDNFWKSLSERTLEKKENQKAIITFLAKSITGIDSYSSELWYMQNFVRQTWDWKSSPTDDEKKVYRQQVADEPWKFALSEIMGIYINEFPRLYAEKRIEYGDSKYPLYRLTANDYDYGAKMPFLYDFLAELGYQISDEELSVLNGSIFEHINDDAPDLPGEEKS